MKKDLFKEKNSLEQFKNSLSYYTVLATMLGARLGPCNLLRLALYQTMFEDFAYLIRESQTAPFRIYRWFMNLPDLPLASQWCGHWNHN